MKNNKKYIIVIISTILLISVLLVCLVIFIKHNTVEKVKGEKPNNTIIKEDTKYYQTNEDGTIHFESKKLEELVQKSLSKDKIYPEDAERVDYLIFTYDYIDSLVGLEFFKNLVTLEFINCGVEDISVISKLQNLKYLYLSDNAIYDISPIKNNKNLRLLSIKNNNIIDISPILELDKLVALPDIYGNSINNYEILEKNISKYNNNLKEDYDSLNNNEIYRNIDNSRKEESDYNDKECLIRLNKELDIDEMNTYKEAMKIAKDFVNKNINSKMNDIEKEAVIVKYISDSIDYDYEEPEKFFERNDFYSSFITGKGVCDNYANMFNILANLSNMESYTARSVSKNLFSQNHAWNVVKIDNKFYHLDITWYDQTKSNQYINVSTKSIDTSHGEDLKYDSKNLPKQNISNTDMKKTIIDKYFS